MHISKWKKPTWKGHRMISTMNMTFWKRQNYGDSKMISGCRGRGSQKSDRGGCWPWGRVCMCWGRRSMGNLRVFPWNLLWILNDSLKKKKSLNLEHMVNTSFITHSPPPQPSHLLHRKNKVWIPQVDIHEFSFHSMAHNYDFNPTSFHSLVCWHMCTFTLLCFLSLSFSL